MAGLPVWRLYCRYFGGDLNTHLNVHSVLDLALRRSFSSSQRAEFVSADEAKVRYVEALNKMYPSWNGRKRPTNSDSPHRQTDNEPIGRPHTNTLLLLLLVRWCCCVLH